MRAEAESHQVKIEFRRQEAAAALFSCCLVHVVSLEFLSKAWINEAPNFFACFRAGASLQAHLTYAKAVQECGTSAACGAEKAHKVQDQY